MMYQSKKNITLIYSGVESSVGPLSLVLAFEQSYYLEAVTKKSYRFLDPVCYLDYFGACH